MGGGAHSGLSGLGDIFALPMSDGAPSELPLPIGTQGRRRERKQGSTTTLKTVVTSRGRASWLGTGVGRRLVTQSPSVPFLKIVVKYS